MTDLLLRTTNVPAMFKNTYLDNYDVKRRPGIKSIHQRICDWDPTESKPALFLQGPPGVGKSMISSALLNEYHDGIEFTSESEIPDEALLVLLQQKCPVFFVQLAEYIGWQIRVFNLRSDFERGIRQPDEYLELDTLLEDLKKRVKVLVIDDVGKEHHTSSYFAQDQFDLLVRTRHNAGLATIYTTNVPVKRWGQEYSPSMQSIIERSSLVIEFP